MELQVIASTSAGNAYLLNCSEGSLLIECGVSLKKIKEAVGSLSKIKACIVSHGHRDHAKGMSSLIRCGIPVYTGVETLRAYNLITHPNTYILEPGERYYFGGFRVTPFQVYHDIPCIGFIIEHEESGKTLFLTDTRFTDFNFPRFDNIIIECNHCPDIIAANKIDPSLAVRIQNAHLGIEGCKAILARNDLSRVNNIVLIHLSDDNSDPERFKNEVFQQTGKKVHIATAGTIIKNFTKHLEPIC